MKSTVLPEKKPGERPARNAGPVLRMLVLWLTVGGPLVAGLGLGWLIWAPGSPVPEHSHPAPAVAPAEAPTSIPELEELHAAPGAEHRPEARDEVRLLGRKTQEAPRAAEASPPAEPPPLRTEPLEDPVIRRAPEPPPIAYFAGGVVHMKGGSVVPEGTPWHKWLDSVKARIERDSGGRIRMKVFLGGKLGGEKEMVEETRNGTLQLFAGSTGALATWVPELAALELPYLFASDAEADFVLDKVREPVAALLEARGFKLVMWAENGWHGYGIQGRCVERPEDLAGLKMRAQESQVHIETYQAFGALPVVVPVPEVLSALQTGTVDGYSNTPLFSFATSWYQGITHYTYTKHIYQPAALVLSKRWHDGLPEDLRRVLLDREDERAGRNSARALTEPLLENFTAAGKTVCRLKPEQVKPWQDQARPVWDRFARRSAGNGKMLDAILSAKKRFAEK